MAQWKHLVGGLLMLVAITNTQASAEVIQLNCEGLYVTVDTVANTASSWADAATRSQAPVYPASISDDEISWTGNTLQGPVNFDMDRHSGHLTMMQNGHFVGSDACEKDAKAF